MVWIDYAIIAVIAFSSLVSLIRGFVREALSLVTWGCAFFVASHYYTYLSVWFTGFEDELVRNGIAIAVLFIATLIVGAIVNFVIGQLVEKTGLSGTDRVLGVCFGALRGVLIVAAILFFLDSFTGVSKSEDWSKSQLIPQFSFIIRWFFDYLQSSSSFLPQSVSALRCGLTRKRRMCGIVGIAGVMPVNQSIYDALTVLQHRGQDAAGIITIDANNCFRLRKANGLVSDVFEARHMQRLQGNMGIGHVRYPTAGSSSASEAQPFYVNSPYGITLAHNGNLTNAHELRKKLFEEKRRHINTTSDSEILLNIFASELDNFRHYPLEADNIFAAIAATNRLIRGAYACVAMIIGHGMVAFRDPNGIRPLVLGKRDIDENRTEYMVASESVALDTLGFDFLRDVAPGEAIYITEEGQLFTRQCADNPVSNPCLFEYVYFARPDSFIDKISVYSARVNMGTKLGEKIAREWEDLDIDVVIPIPETSCDIALEIARILGKPYRQGFVKNRYVGRTFIMPGQQLRRKSVRRKLNANRAEFRDKNVLLVDDSIVRGTTSEQIIEMAREAGAKKVYLASAAPEIRFPNVYGIDMPSATELIAHGREVDEIRQIIGADGLIFQDLNDLIEAVRAENPDIQQFECSVFNGVYVTKDVDQGYLDFLDTLRNDDAKAVQRQNEVENLEMHNEG